jgi:propionyl-CoA carboxylase alpha chain
VDGVRVDDGVYEGGEVSMFYDPMIAKLITWGGRATRRRTGRSPRWTPSRSRAGPQHRFRQRHHAAPALPVGRAHHALHCRGISRRLPRRGDVGCAEAHAGGLAGFATGAGRPSRQIDGQLGDELDPAVVVGGEDRR